MKRLCLLLAALAAASFGADFIYWSNAGADTIPAYAPVGAVINDSLVAVAWVKVGAATATMTVADNLYPGTVSAENAINRAGFRLKLRLHSAASPDTLRRTFRLTWHDADGERKKTDVWMSAAGDSILSTLTVCKLDTVIAYGRHASDSFSVVALPIRSAKAISATTAGTYPLVAIAQEAIYPRTRGRCQSAGEGSVRVTNAVQSGYKLVLDAASGYARGVTAMPDTGWSLGTVLYYCAAGGNAWASIDQFYAGESAIATVPESLIGIPVGTVIEWYGDSASWPARYVLCNGTLKYKNAAGDSVATPDLRGLFLVGANGDSAGRPTSTITGAEHTVGGAISYTPAGTVGAIEATQTVGLNASTSLGSAYAAQTHTHPAPPFSGTAANIIPPFRAAWKLIRSRSW